MIIDAEQVSSGLDVSRKTVVSVSSSSQKTSVFTHQHIKIRLKFVSHYWRHGDEFCWSVLWSDKTKLELLSHMDAAFVWWGRGPFPQLHMMVRVECCDAALLLVGLCGITKTYNIYIYDVMMCVRELFVTVATPPIYTNIKTNEIEDAELERRSEIPQKDGCHQHRDKSSWQNLFCGPKNIHADPLQ